jgi:hypothetical protein
MGWALKLVRLLLAINRECAWLFQGCPFHHMCHKKGPQSVWLAGWLQIFTRCGHQYALVAAARGCRILHILIIQRIE